MPALRCAASRSDPLTKASPSVGSWPGPVPPQPFEESHVVGGNDLLGGWVAEEVQVKEVSQLVVVAEQRRVTGRTAAPSWSPVDESAAGRT
jgi:hypothetical protein